MLDGIHLTLMIGPAVPIPAPKSVIDALTSVHVNSGKDRSGFQLTFSVGKKSPLLNTMLPAGYFDPITTRVIIVVTLNGFPNVIMDGLVTTQELSPSNEPVSADYWTKSRGTTTHCKAQGAFTRSRKPPDLRVPRKWSPG